MSSSNKERLQKVMAARGIASRRKAETMITDGLVKVNGEIVRELGFKVADSDKIEVNDVIVEPERLVYYLINKPRGILSSARDDRDRKTVIDLLPSTVRIFPIGRLDMETTGALICTNDGALTNLLTHPSYHISKTYHVSIEGQLSRQELNWLTTGFKLDGEILNPVKVANIRFDKSKNRSQFDLVLTEGKNRQIRRMMEAMHHDVLKLHRVAIGFLNVDDLHIGEYRELKPFEVKKLRAYIGL